jgi:methanogenic corrinoid protein MtbC1
MQSQRTVEILFEILVNGDRPAARTLLSECLDLGQSPRTVLMDVLWPTYELVERLHRADNLSILSYRLATRLLRVLVDQVARDLPRAARNGRSVFAVCGPSDSDELGAQIAVDMLESSGFAVHFTGGGIPADEVMAHVQQAQPNVLLMFASAPSDLPEIRRMIDQMREIGAAGNTQIAVGGGVFNRAEGLAEEIGADLWASDPAELVETLLMEPARRAVAEQRTVGRKRIRKAA